MRKRMVLPLLILLSMFMGCDDIFPESNYIVTIINETGFELDVYLDDVYKGCVSHTNVHGLSVIEAREIGVNRMDILNVSEGSHVLRFVFKNVIDPFTDSEFEMLEEIYLDSDLEIAVE